VFDILLKSGAIVKRTPNASPALLVAKESVSKLIAHWDQKLADSIVADNFFLDRSAERRAAEMAELAGKHGQCQADPDIQAENRLRGTWLMKCERGWLQVATTLAPTMPPKVQYLSVREVASPEDAATPPPCTR
jgi:hypothetical protein